MLILIGLLIVYIDIYVGNVDVVPDLIGYLLMIPGFFIERGRGRLSLYFLWALLALLVLQALALLTDLPLIPELVMYVAEAFLILLLGRTFLRAVQPQQEDDAALLKVKTVRTAMFYILAAALSSIPLSTVFPVAGHIIRATTALLGLYIVYCLYQFRKDQEQVS